MAFTIDLTNNGTHEGMLAVTTSSGVPGKKNNTTIYIANVEVSYPRSKKEEEDCRSGYYYNKIIATTSEGARFVWTDMTPGATDRGGHARQYGSALHPPCHWGEEEWKAMFEK